MAGKEFGLVCRGQVAVVGDTLVVVVRHEVEEILLEVGTGAADGVDLFLADHLGQRQAQLGGAHGAGQGHEHPAAVVEEGLVSVGGVDQGRGVEVAEVVAQEGRDRRSHGSRHQQDLVTG